MGIREMFGVVDEQSKDGSHSWCNYAYCDQEKVFEVGIDTENEVTWYLLVGTKWIFTLEWVSKPWRPFFWDLKRMLPNVGRYPIWGSTSFSTQFRRKCVGEQFQFPYTYFICIVNLLNRVKFLLLFITDTARTFVVLSPFSISSLLLLFFLMVPWRLLRSTWPRRGRLHSGGGRAFCTARFSDGYRRSFNRVDYRPRRGFLPFSRASTLGGLPIWLCASRDSCASCATRASPVSAAHN